MIKQAYEIIKRNPLPLLLIPLAYSIIEMNFMKLIAPYLATNSIATAFTAQASYIGFGLILFELVRVVFLAGFIPVIISNTGGDNPTLKTFRDNLTKNGLLRMLGLEAIVIPILIAGLMLLIVPGVIWFIFSIFSYFVLVNEKEISVLDCVGKGISKSAGYRMKILGYSVLFGIVSMIAQIVPVISIIVDTIATPFFYTILAMMFREANLKQ
ncbi:MAG: hypothetical protein JXA66_06945 [Oligoflexia bacterium]|nr:hypothetical protein [Oligoflexia bacterium]